MRLPYEPLMGERYYREYARKVVERERRALEISLNQTAQEKVLEIGCLVVGVMVGGIAYMMSGIVPGVIVGIVAAAATAALGWRVVEHRTSDYGQWTVTVKDMHYRRGGKVALVCERKARGRVVERIVR